MTLEPYVKPFVRQQKNDAADAEAICEAAQRPNMRFVAVKSEETQGAATVFRVRELLIRQRTQTINALRGHLSEFGEVVPQGAASMRRLISLIEDPDSDLPETARATLQVLVDVVCHLDERIAGLDAEIAHRAREDEMARRLITIPGIGPLIATALATLAPPSEHFRRARDFAAWLGLTPRQHSTGGKQRLGATTKMGERSLRQLLITGANSFIIKRHTHTAARPGTWLGGMLTRKLGMRVRVALANKMARIVWALMARGGIYKAPVVAASVVRDRGRQSVGGQGAVWRNRRETGSGHPGHNRVPSSTRL